MKHGTNDLQQEQRRALSKARGFAKIGNVPVAKMWMIRATQFWPLSDKQLLLFTRSFPPTMPTSAYYQESQKEITP